MSSQTRTFGSQSSAWLSGLRIRKRKPVSPATMRSYESRVRQILSIVGPDTLLETFGNASLKSFVTEASVKSSDKRVVDLVGVIQQIFKSATNENGDEIFPRKFNLRFADVPVVDKSKQKTPCFSAAQVELCIRQARSYQEQMFYTLLAATGLRISEARSILVNSTDEKLTTWNESEATISVRDSMFSNARMDRLKTPSSRRTVNLHPRINQVIAEFAASEKREPGSYLFQGEDSAPLDENTARTRLARRIPDGAPHSFRRFRISHLRRARMLEEILRAEVGHSDQTMTDHYSHLADDIEARRTAIEQAGFGFSLEKVGHPAQPKPKSKPIVKPKSNRRKEDAQRRSIAAATKAEEARRAALIPEVVSPTLNDLEKARAEFLALGGKLEHSFSRS